MEDALRVQITGQAVSSLYIFFFGLLSGVHKTSLQLIKMSVDKTLIVELLHPAREPTDTAPRIGLSFSSPNQRFRVGKASSQLLAGSVVVDHLPNLDISKI